MPSIFPKCRKSVLCTCVFMCFSLLSSSVHAQTLKTIDDLEQANQKHLDEGINMLGYTSALYTQMDSLLNVVYSKLRKQLAPKEMEQLKQQQREWLKKRDAYFAQLYKDAEKEYGLKRSEWRELEYLTVYQAETVFVKERVVSLITRLNK